MGNAMWVGVRLRDLLNAAEVKPGSVQIQFQGLETGGGAKGLPSNRFLKSLDLSNPVLDECVVAYLMNGEPIPMLNGFPRAFDRTRIFCDLLDERPFLDSRAGQGRRKFLDEDRLSRSGYAARSLRRRT